MDIVSKLARFAPKKPLCCPILLTVCWVFNKPNKVGWRVERPDTDNLQKLLKDCLTYCKFWKDDSYVVHENVYKINENEKHRHGIFIKIEEEEEWKDTEFWKNCMQVGPLLF